MCYSMRCKYQDYEGECRGFRMGMYPEDAACQEENREIDDFYDCPECGKPMCEGIYPTCETGCHTEAPAWICLACGYTERKDA